VYLCNYPGILDWSGRDELPPRVPASDLFLRLGSLHGSGLAPIEQKKAAGTDPTHDATAAARRAEVTRKGQVGERDERRGKVVDLSAFQRDILLLIEASRSADCSEQPG
jgi:hypothetical protein